MVKKALIGILLALALSSTPAFAAQDLTVLMNQLPQQLRTKVEIMDKLGVNRNMLAKMIQNMVQKHMQVQVEAKMLDQVMAARQKGIPAKPVMEKAFEGFAKNVPADKIAQAMKEVESIYAQAYAQAREISKNREVQKQIANNIADALTAGMTEKQMNKVMIKLKTRTKTMAQNKAQKMVLETTKTLAMLVMQGVSPTKAAETIMRALRQKATIQTMQNIREKFTQATSFMSPNRAMGVINNSVSAGNMNGEMGGSDNSGNSGGMGGGMGGAGSSGSGGGGMGK